MNTMPFYSKSQNANFNYIFMQLLNLKLFKIEYLVHLSILLTFENQEDLIFKNKEKSEKLLI